MKSFSGLIVSEVKVLNLSPLIYFKLKTDDQEINCLIHRHALNFMEFAGKGSHVAIFGQYNRRKQFVIHKFMIQEAKLNV